MPRGRKIAAVVTGEARLIDAPSSFAMLPEQSPLRRRPRAPSRLRSPEFLAGFESRVLFYDAFWHADGERVLLVGPPPLNLHWEFQTAKFIALPLDFWLGDRFYTSESVTITELTDVPRGTLEIVARIGHSDYVLPIRQNFAGEFAGRNVIFTMSRDNDLDWIAEWARYHVRCQDVDAVVLFDNGSTRYGIEDIEQKLLQIPGLAKIAVLSWPFAYGAPDRAVLNNPFYSLFCQICAMSVALRRFAPLARGLLNCDVDELVATPEGTTIFDLLAQTSHGLIVMRGQYMEAAAGPGGVAAGRTHRDFPFVLKDPKARQSRQKKWALEPTRPWVSSLNVHPYMHWIHGRPFFSKARPDGVFYRHFRGINTNWKDRRADGSHLSMSDLERDSGFDRLFADTEDVR